MMLFFSDRIGPLATANDNTGGLLLGLFVVVAMITHLLYLAVKYIYGRRNDHLWVEGIFPANLKFSRDHLMEAYICLAARMIQGNTEDAGEKLVYMNKYFNRHFPDSVYDFGESLTYSYRHPIQLKTVAAWLNTRVTSRSERIQVMYFLAGLSMVDGDITGREMALLRKLSELLKLTGDEFSGIISIYRAKHERKQYDGTVASDNRLFALCFKVLGVSQNASMEEVKKAYRKLVKLHHPDRFSNHTKEQQELAEKRFLEIQKAYEILEKHR